MGARRAKSMLGSCVAAVVAACGCSGPPAGSFNNVIAWAGTQQTMDEFDSGLGGCLAIGGEFVDEVSLQVRGRFSWCPGESVDRSEVSTEVGLINFGGRYVGPEVLFGFGFHFLDSGDWGTGFSFGLGVYRLVSPEVRLELALWDYASLNVGGDDVGFANDVEAALWIGFRL